MLNMFVVQMFQITSQDTCLFFIEFTNGKKIPQHLGELATKSNMNYHFFFIFPLKLIDKIHTFSNFQINITDLLFSYYF